MTTYFVTTDTDEFNDDNGDYQVSYMTQKISSPTPLSDKEVVEKSIIEGNWKIYFGEGEVNTLGQYQVELCDS